MKKINFTNAGGFPLEQETLARLQAAYKDELYEMLKRNFDISNDQNYLISQPTDTLNGWFVINGTLHLMEPGVLAPTNFIKTSETITKLRFGDGVYQPAYTDHTVEYVSGIPVDYDSSLEEFGLADGDIALPNERKFRYYNITNITTNPDRLLRIGFLPIDGSKPMEGDLDMGGNQLSNLDTLETALATLRAKFFNFGFSTERGEPGRALVDEEITISPAGDSRPVNIDSTALHLNYNSDWGTTVIGGEIKLPEFAENSTSLRKSPLLIDSKGNVCKGSASENIPLGLIALWYNVNQPIPPGWLLCNAANEGEVGSITVPNLTGNRVSPTANVGDLVTKETNIVNYIIYVGRDTPTINAFIVDLARESKNVIRTLSSGQTSFDATANPFELEVALENLTLQGWTQVSGPSPSTITAPSSINTTVTGSLVIGTYVYQVTGVDALGAEFTDQVSISIRRSNIPPVFELIENTTSGVDVTNDMDIVITSDLILQEDTPSELAESAQNRASQDQIDTDLDLARQLVQRRTAFRVGVSDPDGNIFSSSVTVVARIRRANGTEEIIQPLLLEDVSDSSANRASVDQSLVKFFNFSIVGLTATDILDFIATDEDGGETVKSYSIIVNLESGISLFQTGPTLTTVNGDLAKFFDVRIQGTPNATVPLVIEGLLSSSIANIVTVTNNGGTPSSFNFTGTDIIFNVLLDTTGSNIIRVLHQMTIPPLTTINNGSLYSVNTRVSLASNSLNGVNLRFTHTLTGNPIDIIPIDDTPIDDFPIGGGGGGCFDVNTYVSLESGSAKKLKNVQTGEMLIGLDFPNRTDASSGNYFNWTGKLSEAIETPVRVVNKRTFTVASYFEIVTKDGRVLKVTGDHPLLTSKDGSQVQWLPAQSVNETMSLVDKKGDLKVVQSITWISEPLEVATIDVEDVDNYVIGGIVAHNKEIIAEEDAPQQ
ncbi:MAG: hypothetical protein ACI9Y7_000264 [Dokdonia sp.]|jgi:hypothetical protein